MALTSSGRPARRTVRRYKVREWLTAYTFILPSLLIIGVFGLFPIGYAFYMSLYSWRVRQGRFIGLEHYHDLVGNWAGGLAFVGGVLLILVAHWLWNDAFRRGQQQTAKLAGALALMLSGVGIALGWALMMRAGDDDFLGAIVITLFYALGTVPVQILLALFLATLLFQKIRGREFFRMLFFLPYITPLVASAVVFSKIFTARESGWANVVLGWFGVAPQRWLQEATPLSVLMLGDQIDAFNRWLVATGATWQLDGLWLGPSLALTTIVIFGIWTYTGYNVIIFLAGLGGIPGELYEAADIDGANGWHKFRYITVPLLSPVTFYLTLLGFIGTFQAFSQLYVMREPFARGSVDTASLVIFDTFYKSNNYSLAAAQSILLFVLILLVTLLQQRIFGKRVFYG